MNLERGTENALMIECELFQNSLFQKKKQGRFCEIEVLKFHTALDYKHQLVKRAHRIDGLPGRLLSFSQRENEKWSSLRVYTSE